MAKAFQIAIPDPNIPFTIGRKQENSLSIQDMLVSRFHAVIHYHENEWIIKSLTQNSITELNSHPIEESKINDGDVIHIGPHLIRAIIKEKVLSLIVLHLNDIPTQIQLSSEWVPIVLEENENLFEKATARIANNNCEISLPHAIINEKGKRQKKIFLKNNEHVRFPWSDISFHDGILYSQKAPIGYDVHVEDLDIYAGKKQLLKGLNFDLPAGEILAIIGRSGQGKSSLLRLFEGILCAGKKSIVRIGTLDYRHKEIRQRIAILAQEPELRKDLTVEETLINGARVSMNKSEFQKKAREQLENFTKLFGLNDKLKHRVDTLSGGETRRVALAQELMGSPGLILLDEPLTGLDPYNAKILCNHLKQLSFLGHTIILTTHSYEALDIANKVLLLHKGCQGFFGTPQGAFQYFKTNDADAILNNLDDNTEARWIASDSKISSTEPTHYTHYYFLQTKRSSTFLSNFILIGKQWIRDKAKIAAIFLQPIIIGFLLSQIFSKQTPLWIVSFALILCANWFALSLSIREIVSEKKILLNEFRKGVKIFPTITAKIIFPLIISFIQITITYACCAFRLSTEPNLTSVLLAFSFTVAPAVAIGIMVSAISRNAGQANTFLPLLIIPQISLAGALIPLDQMRQIGHALSSIIWSRYNQNTLLNTFLNTSDDIQNKLRIAELTIGFYIITILIIHFSKKAK